MARSTPGVPMNCSHMGCMPFHISCSACQSCAESPTILVASHKPQGMREWPVDTDTDMGTGIDIDIHMALRTFVVDNTGKQGTPEAAFVM